MSYYVYILKCADNTFYTGITTDIERRIKEHNGIDKYKKGAKYTATRRPVKLIYSAKFKNRSTASKEEYRIKKLSRTEKKELVKENRIE